MKSKLLLTVLFTGICFYCNAQYNAASDSMVKSKKYNIKIGESFVSIKQKIGQLRNDNYNPQSENTYYSVSDDLLKWDNHLISKSIILKFDKEQRLFFFKVVYTIESSISQNEILRFVKERINNKEIFCNDFLQKKKVSYIKQQLGVTHKWAIYSTASYSQFYYSLN